MTWWLCGDWRGARDWHPRVPPSSSKSSLAINTLEVFISYVSLLELKWFYKFLKPLYNLYPQKRLKISSSPANSSIFPLAVSQQSAGGPAPALCCTGHSVPSVPHSFLTLPCTATEILGLCLKDIKIERKETLLNTMGVRSFNSLFSHPSSPRLSWFCGSTWGRTIFSSCKASEIWSCQGSFFPLSVLWRNA